MIWHIVRFDCSGLEPAERADLETRLSALGEIDLVRWIRVGPDVADPAITGLITAFDDVSALEAYRTHPAHVPVVEEIRALGLPTVRLDIATDDDPVTLP